MKYYSVWIGVGSEGWVKQIGGLSLTYACEWMKSCFWIDGVVRCKIELEE